MKNFILYFLFLFLASTYTLSAQNNSDKKTKPVIKSVTVSEQDYDDGKPDDGPETKSQTFFDKKGNIIKEIDYKDGKIDEIIEYEYNSDSQKTKEVKKNHKGNIKKTTTYKYNNGLKVEKAVYDENNVIKSKKIYSYEKF